MKKIYKQYPKIISAKTAKAAGLRSEEAPFENKFFFSDEAIRALSVRLMLLKKSSDKLDAICWVANKMLGHSYRDIAQYLPLSYGRVGDRVRRVDEFLQNVVPKERDK